MLERAGRTLFRWRSYTPLLLVVVALPLLWRSRGPASPLWLFAGVLLCVAGQALRAWVLGEAKDGTSGQDETLQASSLNTDGPYALTRNPLYLGNLAITLGLCLVAHDALLLAAVAALFFVQYRAIVAAEERFLGERFGAAYARWCAKVPRFWPRLARPGSARPWDFRRALRKEHNPAAAWLLIAILLVASDHLGGPLWPYALALALVFVLWLCVKGWKHGWLRGNFLNDFRRRLRAAGR